jgi:hypothetical protein
MGLQDVSIVLQSCNRIVQYICIIPSIIQISGSSERTQVHDSLTRVSVGGSQADTKRSV